MSNKELCKRCTEVKEWILSHQHSEIDGTIFEEDNSGGCDGGVGVVGSGDITKDGDPIRLRSRSLIIHNRTSGGGRRYSTFLAHGHVKKSLRGSLQNLQQSSSQFQRYPFLTECLELLSTYTCAYT